MKLRMKFTKSHLTKFISHLDLIRAFERALRRASLPVAYTQGFNPRPKMSFSPALSVGITSNSEYMDVNFCKEVPPQVVISRLNQALPDGLQILKAGIADDKLPLSALNGAMYLVKIGLNGVFPEELEKTIENLLHQEKIIIKKTTKSRTRLVNIAPLIYNIRVLDNDYKFAKLSMELSIGQNGSVSPIQITCEIEKSITKQLKIISIHREELFLKNDKNKIIPL